MRCLLRHHRLVQAQRLLLPCRLFTGGEGVRERVVLRTAHAHRILVDALSVEFEGAPLPPPPESVEWPASVLRQWYADGGGLRLANLAREAPATRTRLVDSVGADLPVVALRPDRRTEKTVLGALASGDGAYFDALAAALSSSGVVACRLGLGEETLGAVVAEAEVAWPLMRPGELAALKHDEEGATVLVAGTSPSGYERGDWFLQYGELPSTTEEGVGSGNNEGNNKEGNDDGASWPALTRAHNALGAFADAFAPRLPSLKIHATSDTFVARFPGDGRGYGAHYDGHGGACVLTAILYTSPAWCPSDGGMFHALDPHERAWLATPPEADTLLVFRADRILHKVLPCFAPRVALTTFLSKAA